ncbi:diguanylate cyclase (GGDEF) domain-containing protein [Rivularia sp. PCC 7116]|uniref:response regulator n=1 Tax=Rivularia sp. PCC 7116 TaxID=373994 RepID=UPI00029EDBD5|nr:response regulator [Rivularia sp. PCC 7116]AFY53546.1 diguanylate cyclase (GGDEF) domain-containing protein [Rivularia sp. PCC 7116]
MKILLVNDDGQFTKKLKANLTKHRYVVDTAVDGQEGWEFVEAQEYDLIVLDVMLPKLDGITFCSRLRAKGLQVLVMFLTSRAASEDKIKGLDAGADDYVVKPVPLPELTARIRALLRRKQATVSTVLEWGNLTLEARTGEVKYADVALNLTKKEYSLLELFMQDAQKIYSQNSILNQLWTFEDEPPTRDAIRTLIKRLRQKLKAAKAPDLIETVFGVGYRLNPAFEEIPSADSNLLLNKKLPEFGVSSTSEKTDKQTQTSPNAIESDRSPIRLLIVDEDKEFIDTLVELATTRGWQTAIAPNAKLATESLQRIRPDIILLNISIDKRKDEFTFLEEMSLEQPLIPLLVFTSEEFSADRVALARRKSQGFFHKPISSNRVFEVITQSLKPVKKIEAKVMVVDDDRMILSLVRTLLEPWGIKVDILNDSLQFWDRLESVKPDLLILDVQMPNVDGIELCQLLRNDSRWAWLPIIFLTGQRDTETIQQVFSAGADDFINKPVIAPELITRIFNRLERNRLLREQAEINSITGLPNRQRATQDLERLLHLAKQYQQYFCLSILKIDDLNQVNRNYGHGLGDKILRRLASLLQKELRTEDIVSSWNGGEFLVGMYGINRGYGVEWLAEVLEIFRSTEFEFSQDSFPITFSAGVTQFPEDGTDIHMLYQSAASTMEKARDMGGNRILASNWKPLKSSQSLLYKDVILLHQNSEFASSIMDALLTRSYHVDWLKDGKSALEILAKTSSSLHGKVILLEENLPVFDGLEILKQLRANKVIQHSKVVWLSTTISQVEKALSWGCLDYINIPCNISSFMYRLRHLLER